MGGKSSKSEVPCEKEMYATIKKVFRLRELLSEVKIMDFDNAMKLALLECFGLRSSSFEEKFLEKLDPHLVRRFYSKQGRFQLDRFLEEFHMNGVYVAKEEEADLSTFLQAFHCNFFNKKEEYLNVGYFVIVLKFRFILSNVMNVGKNKIKSYEENGLVVNEAFIDSYCRLKLKREFILSSNSKIKVSFIITSPRSETPYQKLQKGVVVKMKLLSVYDLVRKNESFPFGIFHPSIQIGDVVLEWDSFSFVCCQSFRNSWSSLNCNASFVVCEVDVEEKECDKLISSINKILEKWNRGMLYSRSQSDDYWGNCHHFFMQIRQCLEELDGYSEPDNVKKVFANLKYETNLGIGTIFDHGMSKEFKSFVKSKGDLLEFVEKMKVSTSHREYDDYFAQFDNTMKEIYQKDMKKDFKGDLRMFEAIDAGFWMRRIRAEKSNQKIKSAEKMELFKNMMKSKFFIDLEYNSEESCPFENSSRSYKMENRNQVGLSPLKGPNIAHGATQWSPAKGWMSFDSLSQEWTTPKKT